MFFSHSSHQRGFSTLMALGTISVLLILVTGLATTYMRELRLSRATYDEILSSAGAEGMFEYAMLKVRNHRDGFSDSVSLADVDGTILTPTTDRSKNLKSGYTIVASSTGSDFSVAPDSHLIIPLFSAP
jgi:Tfp pilus assembly protein PilX